MVRYQALGSSIYLEIEGWVWKAWVASWSSHLSTKYHILLGCEDQDATQVFQTQPSISKYILLPDAWYLTILDRGQSKYKDKGNLCQQKFQTIPLSYYRCEISVSVSDFSCIASEAHRELKRLTTPKTTMMPMPYPFVCIHYWLTTYIWDEGEDLHALVMDRMGPTGFSDLLSSISIYLYNIYC